MTHMSNEFLGPDKNRFILSASDNQFYVNKNASIACFCSGHRYYTKKCIGIRKKTGDRLIFLFILLC